MNLRMGTLLLAALSLGLAGLPLQAQRPLQAASGEILVDDFEDYEHEGLPTQWKFLDANKDVVFVKDEHMRPNERFFVVEEDGNKFVRAYANGEAVRVIMPTQEEGLRWNLDTHPRLRWQWRAVALPEGADETKSKLNDTGAAVYVVFSVNMFGPKTIKYTYSSTQPVGTVKSYNWGRMKVMVVASGVDGFGQWMNIERDIVADYRTVFKKDPPNEPLTIMLWSDSDDTEQVAEVDFDNIVLSN